MLPSTLVCSFINANATASIRNLSDMHIEVYWKQSKHENTNRGSEKIRQRSNAIGGNFLFGAFHFSLDLEFVGAFFGYGRRNDL
jgi:hypothetical protein